MFKFEELQAYKEAVDFTNEIYQLSDTFPRNEHFSLTNQLRRAAISIVLNIAEGSSRGGKDFQRFLMMSRGSCFECVAILQICKNRRYITANDYEKYYEFCDKLSRMLNNLNKYLSTTHNP